MTKPRERIPIHQTVRKKAVTVRFVSWVKLHTDSIHVWYIHLEPQWPLFLKVNPPKSRPFPIKTRGLIWVLGIYTYFVYIYISSYYIYIYITFYTYIFFGVHSTFPLLVPPYLHLSSCPTGRHEKMIPILSNSQVTIQTNRHSLRIFHLEKDDNKKNGRMPFGGWKMSP